MSDFFEKMTQDKIIQLIKAVSRHPRSEDDFNKFMVPILRWLVPRSESHDSKDSLMISNIIITIVFSIYNFLGPADFVGHGRLINSMEATGLFAKSLDILKVCGEIIGAKKNT